MAIIETSASRPSLIVAGAVLASAIVVSLVATFDPSMSWGGDNALYLSHARNLLAGIPYNATGYIQNPWAFLGPSMYPPGWPIMLMPALALAGLNIPVLTAYAIGLFIVTLCVFAGYTHRDLVGAGYGPSCWLGVIALVGLNPLIHWYVQDLYSEGAFLLTLYAALWALRVTYDRQEAGRSWLMLSLLAAFLVGATSAIRIFGILLVPSIVLFELVRYQRLTPAGLTCAGAALLLWGLQNAWVAHISLPIDLGVNRGYGYLVQDDLIRHWTQLPQTISTNLLRYRESVCSYWTTGVWRIDRLIRYLVPISLLLALIGFLYRTWTRRALQEVFCMVYVLSLLLWSASNPRYLLPVVPLYIIYVCIGLREIETRVLGLRVPLLLGAAFAASGFVYSTIYAKSTSFNTRIAADAPNGADARSLYAYIERETRADAVIIFRKPRVLALFTHRASTSYADAENPWRPDNDPRLFAYAQDIGARYVLTGPPDAKDSTEKFAARHADRLKAIYLNNTFTLYRIEP